MRIDVMYDGTHPPLLLEIEAGSSRLFLNEAERVEEYAAMVNQRVLAATRKTKQNRSGKEEGMVVGG
jgi:hypothetical protein